jgi:ribonuclease-3
MPGPVVIFRTHSDVEAGVVRGLLESHGIQVLLSSAIAHTLFPLTIDGLGEVRMSVHPDDADEARRIIESHRTDVDDTRVVRMGEDPANLERRIAYRFREPELLEQALTHRSRANEDEVEGSDNESLEFLGDAILGFLVAELLFREFPADDEGRKSKMKAALVSTASLARAADRLALGSYLRLGRGEEKTGGRRKTALLADGFEALVAAMYLDGGLEHVRAFIERELAGSLDEVRRAEVVGQDYKSALQERLQATSGALPVYQHLPPAGPDHRKRFEVDVLVNGEAVARGSGGSKKEAEQEAARVALDRLAGPTDR